MSLRTRLIAGMVVVSFVLVAVAFIIARTTEANLVDRVDQQLVSAATQLPPVGVAFAAGGDVAVGPTSVYAACIQNGVIHVVSAAQRDHAEAGAPEGDGRSKRWLRRATGDAFTVSSTSGSGRYRVLALRGTRRRGRTSSASRSRTST